MFKKILYIFKSFASSFFKGWSVIEFRDINDGNVGGGRSHSDDIFLLAAGGGTFRRLYCPTKQEFLLSRYCVLSESAMLPFLW